MKIFIIFLLLSFSSCIHRERVELWRIQIIVPWKDCTSISFVYYDSDTTGYREMMPHSIITISRIQI